MSKESSGLVVIEMSMSLDGYVAGPEDNMAHRLGTRGGERVFDWYTTGKEHYPEGSMFRTEGPNRAVAEEMFARFGAYVSGRRTYDMAHGWNGRHPVNGVPVFILTHTPDPSPPKGESDLVFVTNGIESAIKQALVAARGKDVSLLGASPGQQALAAGLVDEIFIHIAPLLLGAGVRMFERLGERAIDLELVETFGGPKASHLRYRVGKAEATERVALRSAGR
jgi:dihydrofolate reductase